MKSAQKETNWPKQSGSATAFTAGVSANETPRPKLALSRLAFGLAFAFSLAVVSHWTSGNIYHRHFHRAESIHFLETMTTGQFLSADGKNHLPMFQNRVVMPFAFRALRAAGLRSDPAYYLLMLGGAFLDYLLLWYLFNIRLGASDKATTAALLVICVSRILTYAHGWEHACDVLDVSFLVGYAVLALEKRWLPLFAVALLGSANRESSVFAGVIWIALYGLDVKGKVVLRAVALGGALMVSCYAFVQMLRIFTMGYGPWKQNGYQDYVLLLNVKSFFTKFTSLAGLIELSMLCALCVPIAGWLWLNREHFGHREKRLLLAGALVLGATLNFGLLFETRTLLAPMAVFLVAALCAEMKSAPPPAIGRGYPQS